MHMLQSWAKLLRTAFNGPQSRTTVGTSEDISGHETSLVFRTNGAIFFGRILNFSFPEVSSEGLHSSPNSVHQSHCSSFECCICGKYARLTGFCGHCQEYSTLLHPTRERSWHSLHAPLHRHSLASALHYPTSPLLFLLPDAFRTSPIFSTEG